MLLTVKERVLVGNLLPAEGNLRTMKTISQLRNDLLFNEDEVKQFQIVTDGPRISWDVTKDEPVDIKIGELATEIIVEALKRMDQDNKLTLEYVPIYERFIEGQ